MPRVGTILREYEATAVRKVVCAEGAERAAITQFPYWMCGVDMMDLYCEKRMNELNKQVQLDVLAADSRSGSFVVVIQKIVQAGRVVLAPRHGNFNKGRR